MFKNVMNFFNSDKYVMSLTCCLLYDVMRLPVRKCAMYSLSVNHGRSYVESPLGKSVMHSQSVHHVVRIAFR